MTNLFYKRELATITKQDHSTGRGLTLGQDKHTLYFRDQHFASTNQDIHWKIYNKGRVVSLIEANDFQGANFDVLDRMRQKENKVAK